MARSGLPQSFFFGEQGLDATAKRKSASALAGLTEVADIALPVTFVVNDSCSVTRKTIFADSGYTIR